MGGLSPTGNGVAAPVAACSRATGSPAARHRRWSPGPARIEQGKEMAMSWLSPQPLDFLRSYRQLARPAYWLFPGRDAESPIHPIVLYGSCRSACAAAKQATDGVHAAAHLCSSPGFRWEISAGERSGADCGNFRGNYLPIVGNKRCNTKILCIFSGVPLRYSNPRCRRERAVRRVCLHRQINYGPPRRTHPTAGVPRVSGRTQRPPPPTSSDWAVGKEPPLPNIPYPDGEPICRIIAPPQPTRARSSTPVRHSRSCR
jgi:hypothetical protein